MIIDKSINCTYDVHMVTNKEFSDLFLPDTNITTFMEAETRSYLTDPKYYSINGIIHTMKYRRIPKVMVNGLDGILYMDVNPSILKPSNRQNEQMNDTKDQMMMFECNSATWTMQPFYNTDYDNGKMRYVVYFDATIPHGYHPEIYACTIEEFNVIFPFGTDITFMDELHNLDPRNSEEVVSNAMKSLWSRRVPLCKVKGIHGTLFDRMDNKVFYPTRKDEEAVNPDGSRLRLLGACAGQKTAFPVYKYLNPNEETECLDEESDIEGWDTIKENITNILNLERSVDWLDDVKLNIYPGWNFPELKKSPYLKGDDLYAYIQDQNDN